MSPSVNGETHPEQNALGVPARNWAGNVRQAYDDRRIDRVVSTDFVHADLFGAGAAATSLRLLARAPNYSSPKLAVVIFQVPPVRRSVIVERPSTS